MSWLLPPAGVGSEPGVQLVAVVSGITEFGCEGSLDAAGERAKVRGALAVKPMS
jgi:hypothetical protein